MNDSKQIEEGAIVDAIGDFEALNEWLEKLKGKVAEIGLKSPKLFYGSLSVFSLGYFLGLRSKSPVKWIQQILSGILFGFSAVNLYNEFKKDDKPEEEKTVEEKTEEPETKLKNVKVINE